MKRRSLYKTDQQIQITIRDKMYIDKEDTLDDGRVVEGVMLEKCVHMT